MGRSQGSETFWREKETVNSRTKSERQRSEADWEKWFIRRLGEIGWVFRSDLKNEKGQTSEERLSSCLLKQLRRLCIKHNNLSDSFEFTKKEKIYLLQELNSVRDRDLSKPIELDISRYRTAKPLKIPLIDLENIDNNRFWLASQVKERKREFTHVYDLVLLINGIPLVCIELKKATISANEALEQLRNYEEDRLRCKPLSIFNNFQLFIALNFQRFYCLKRKELLKVNMEDKKAREHNYIYLVWLDEQIRELFKRSWVLKQIFREESISQKQRYYTSVAQPVRALKRTRTYSIDKTREINLSASETFRHLEDPSVKTKVQVHTILVALFLLAVFLLINFLSRWAWWTVVFGFLFTLVTFFGWRKWVGK
ncbi:hypothetical protein DNK47_03105 [Mycoplasma wenyonii]|uniref:type I site-specific deoxyribonuclease n=1 Tax=Mycoplasma wenyonii TaxID=65123 RepID=A0A328PJ20_9MOLU|nr:type I restriction endonuclease [Mycoplasma wenyonii]RAO94802.1 hypothetical protein DNK47_03105 [Mycoplasma wenyonii]